MWDYYFNNVGGCGFFNLIVDLLLFLGVKFLKNKYYKVVLLLKGVIFRINIGNSY